MFCTNCGTQNPDGTAFCTNCGAKLDATTQAAPKAASNNKVFWIIALVGSGLMLLGSFLPWITVKISMWGMTLKESASLLKLGGIDTLGFFLIFLTALFLLAWELAEVIAPLKALKTKLSNIKVANISVIDCGVAALAFIVIIIAFFRKGGAGAEGMSAYTHAAIGAWAALLGIIAVIVTKVMNIIKK